ncbi:MAG: 2-oxoglutarate dehydrogenase E1 component [Longimicrobiales bacterium]
MPNGFDGYNAGYAQSIYEQWLRDPASVDEAWRRVFRAPVSELGLIATDASGTGGSPLAVAPPVGTAAARSDPREVRAAKAAAELIEAYRLNGHYGASLDPLDGAPRGHPTLDPLFHGIAAEELDNPPALHIVGDVLDWLRSIYTGSIGFEYEHLQDPEREEWLREQIESGQLLRPLSADQQKRLLGRLTEVEGFEQFLHRAYLGAKRFSIEGTDMLVPMLDLAIERAATAGASEVVLGMAHRGRLNVLVHVLGRPYQKILAQFEGQHSGFGTTGDVKYHLGAEGTYATASGEPLTVTLAPNPSHLEAVDPVVEGIARAKQTDRASPDLERDEDSVVPVLIHGDAAFAGQGIVAETLNLACLPGYSTGGTLHIIANNQIGFTTTPGEGRSTVYASDLARGFDVPIFHVNADDPTACLAVTRLAMAYRTRFHRDVVIDLIGYRRYGHNEGDEPAYTQPAMYEAIREHPAVRKLWADRLVEEGTLTADEVQRIWDSTYQHFIEAQEAAANSGTPASTPAPEKPTLEPQLATETSVPADALLEIDRALHAWPESFRPHPKLERQLRKRAAVLPEGGLVDWAHAEALAFGALLRDGTPIRLTGQDTERGTFSQRHLVLHAESGDSYVPLAHVPDARAAIRIYNSPLSELGCMGFEYGYSTAAPESLVLWEAQFGDFVNGGQIIIDQFMIAGRAKWSQTSNLVLLLPHGYEGQGPEHSSARIERFLQSAAEDNIRVANCTTPAQYFHLLRRQAKLEERRPLIVFTPKSLLRHPNAVSALDAFVEGGFHFVLGDATVAKRKKDVTRAVLCTGKVCYDIAGSEERESAGDVALLRLEQLYPFPEDALLGVLRAFPALDEIVWAQEEPANMGAWRFLEPRLRRVAAALAGDVGLSYAGRPERASPAEGFVSVHEEQQTRLVRAALGLEVAAATGGAQKKRATR